MALFVKVTLARVNKTKRAADSQRVNNQYMISHGMCTFQYLVNNWLWSHVLTSWTVNIFIIIRARDSVLMARVESLYIVVAQRD